MISSFDHVTLAVSDLDAAVDSYAALLGRAPSWRGAHPGLGTRAALFGLRNALIELVGAVPDAPEADGLRAHLAANGEGLQGFTLGCADAAAESRDLRARGVRAAPPEDGEAQSATGEHRRFRVVALSPNTTRKVSVTLVERVDPIGPPEEPFAPGEVAALDHVVVRTADCDAAIALYRDALGIRLALDKEIGNTRMLFFRVGGMTLEIIHDRTLGAIDVLHGLAYRVGDIAAARARMVAAGLDVSEVRTGRKDGTAVFTVRSGTAGVPTLVLRDPTRD